LPHAAAGDAPDRFPLVCSLSWRVEHIVSRRHGGAGDPGGLALACDRRNAYKGPNLTSIDPGTSTVVALFSPRADVWSEHFVVRDGHILGLTPTGRATVRLLKMNAARRVELRGEWSAKVDWR